MVDPAESPPPKLPFPIFKLSSKVERYMLYDIDTVTWLRRSHHILGVLVGTLPQAPQQNVFLGLPLELMAEEARLLLEKDLAYLVNDLKNHEKGITRNKRKAFMQDLANEGEKAAEAAQKKRTENTEKAMRKLRLSSTPIRELTPDTPEPRTFGDPMVDDESFFASPPESKPKPTSQTTTLDQDAWTITPTTSDPPFSSPKGTNEGQLPKVQASSYAVFKHLHARGYYMSPGLRFGCQYMAYPGDPLRFHSHFLAVGLDWDEELDLMDIIGGGRLGTGVKKGFLISGIQPDKTVRTLCIEWAGM